MVSVEREITEEQYKKAQNEGIESILPVEVLCGYGYYGGSLIHTDGKYFVKYKRGETCD